MAKTKPASGATRRAPVVTRPAPASPVAVDLDAARAAYERQKKRLAALPAASVLKPNVSADGAVTAARALVRRARRPDVAVRLAKVHAELFDVALIDRLDEGALALFFAHGKASGARDRSTRAKLPPALVLRATAQRARMMRLASYHFDDDPTLGPELARIRVGTGFADLAHDLSDIADVYDQRLAEVRADPKYVADDETTARATAAEILGALGLTTEDGWIGAEARAFTALKQDYADVAATIAWITRNDDGREDVPTLVAAAAPGAGKKIAKALREHAAKARAALATGQAAAPANG